MMKRRQFVQLAGLTAPFLAFRKLEKPYRSPGPIVISTWAPNVKANAEAWKILQSGGAALDAVHKGVMVPEADPADQSVGYGGLPDRDGRVTLDACVMDHLANIGAVMCLEFIKHPVSVARLVMEKTPHVQLVGT
jgi:N4-(beta-N-acetylglucosaminyl)-L-asparaginase